MNHQEKIVRDCLDDTLSQADQKHVARNAMTIVYLLRENDYWTKRFSPLYAIAVQLSHVAHGQKNLSPQQLKEFSTILEVPETELLKRAGQTKQRHGYFKQLLHKLGRFDSCDTSNQSADKVLKEALQTHPPKQVAEPESFNVAEEDLRLSDLLGDVVEEILSLGDFLE